MYSSWGLCVGVGGLMTNELPSFPSHRSKKRCSDTVKVFPSTTGVLVSEERWNMTVN